MSAVFIDTNVLVYANQRRARHHEVALAALERVDRAETVLWISRQVLREYVAAVTRPQGDEPALRMETAVQRARTFAARFEVAEDGPEAYEIWLDLLRQVPIGGKHVHDANLIATMRVYGITRLLTFNVTDFRRFGSLIDLVTP